MRGRKGGGIREGEEIEAGGRESHKILVLSKLLSEKVANILKRNSNIII